MTLNDEIVGFEGACKYQDYGNVMTLQRYQIALMSMNVWQSATQSLTSGVHAMSMTKRASSGPSVVCVLQCQELLGTLSSTLSLQVLALPARLVTLTERTVASANSQMSASSRCTSASPFPLSTHATVQWLATLALVSMLRASV